MNIPEDARYRGHRLLQAGVVLFLLALLVGLAVPRFTVPRLALSTHLLGITQGTFLIAAGLLWPKLRLTPSLSRFGQVAGVYGCAAAWTANLIGATVGAGATMVPMAAGGARGTVAVETLIKVLLITAAISLLSVTIVMLWGLRMPERSESPALLESGEGV